MTSSGKRAGTGSPRPIVKWAGGKTQIIEDIRKNLPLDYSNYIEPFLGGGAVYFYLYRNNLLSAGALRTEYRPPILSDRNQRLIGMYRAICNNPEKVMKRLDSLMSKRNKEDYYDLREKWKTVTDATENAALFIYFNKMCYNGLYRVNQNQEFNVPWGKRSSVKLYNIRTILSVSEALSEAVITCEDFEFPLNWAEEDSFVYLDPPYHFPNRENGFTSYTSKGFSEDEQIRLAQEVRKLSQKGCKILISNSDTPLIRSLYPEDEGFFFERITARRLISCNAEGREEITEVLIRNYPSIETEHIRLSV